MPTNRSGGLLVPRPGQMYLWTLLADDATDAATASRLQVVLSANERNEARRFRHVTDQQQFVIARALVRLTLSHHFPIPADAWRFDRDYNGKPYIVAPAISPSVRFSLSHTQGLVACLITLSAEAAVDVEKTEHSHDLALVARQVLTPAEQGVLSQLSGRDWTTRFFDLWTLKEAYAKARGLGLSITLSDFGFELDPDDSIRVHFSSRVNDDPSAWIFWRRQLSSQHTIAIAAKKDLRGGCEIILRKVRFDGARIALEAPDGMQFRVSSIGSDCQTLVKPSEVAALGFEYHAIGWPSPNAGRDSGRSRPPIWRIS